RRDRSRVRGAVVVVARLWLRRGAASPTDRRARLDLDAGHGRRPGPDDLRSLPAVAALGADLADRVRADRGAHAGDPADPPRALARRLRLAAAGLSTRADAS